MRRQSGRGLELGAIAAAEFADVDQAEDLELGAIVHGGALMQTGPVIVESTRSTGIYKNGLSLRT